MASWSPQVVKTFVRGGRCSCGTQALNINRRGPLFWPTRSKVVASSRTASSRSGSRTTRAIWAFVLEPTATGTRLVHERRTPDGIAPISLTLQKHVLGGVERFTGELKPACGRR